MSGKRSIFEEVGEGARASAPQGGMIDRGRGGARGAIRIWLAILFAMVVAMIAVGGLTRLTDSGLSITEWRPITGALPPLSDAAWESEFAKYREIPEYQLQNKGMSMSEFKTIYYWEWGHRQLGRTVGLVWALGFFWFLIRRQIPTGWTGRLLLPGVLGGMQGAIGWWMVHSGLSGEMLDVASYRLATHLGLAFVILGVLAWYMFHMGRAERELMQARRGGERKAKALATGLMHLAFLQILLGALVAGIDAGRNYVDWPWMSGGFTPPDMWQLEPWWRNLFENDGTVQFMHRIAGYLLALMGVYAWWRTRAAASGAVRFAFNAILGMMAVQLVLGIVTVMNSAPLTLALAHQLGAVALWVLILRARFLSIHPPFQSVRG